MMRILITIYFVLFLCSCEPQKVSTYIELDNGCFGLGFSEEVEILPNENDPYSEPGFVNDMSLINRIVMGDGTIFYWDRQPGKWTRFTATDGIEYQSFLLRFCIEKSEV